MRSSIIGAALKAIGLASQVIDYVWQFMGTTRGTIVDSNREVPSWQTDSNQKGGNISESQIGLLHA